MTDPRPPGRSDDDRLTELLSDAVSDVEPPHRLDSIRNRTKVTAMSASKNSGRPWRFAVGGAVVATAAVIAAIAFAGGNLGLTGSDDPGPATETSGTPRPSEPTASSSETVTPSPITVAAYYLGETPRGVRLYREFTRVEADSDLSATVEALTRTPSDPDYATAWDSTSLTAASYDGDVIEVVVDSSVRERPAGMSEEEASAAVQQVIYSVQAATQTRSGVQFRSADGPMDQVFGVPTSEPLAEDPPLDTLALVNVTTPEQGSSVSGSFTASGVASSFEANVPWEIRDGSEVVASGFATAEGWMDKLYPWSTEVDVSDLAPGEYTFVAMTDDPSGGEGGGPFVDTKSITIR